MAMANAARFIAAAALTAVLTAPQALAAEKMGKMIIIDQVLKRDKKAADGAGAAGGGGQGVQGGQTARRPVQGGGNGEGEFGVERPAPEGRDPFEVKGDGGQPRGGGERREVAPRVRSKTGGSGGSAAAGGKGGDGTNDLPPGD